MNSNDLMARMRELDQPAVEAAPVVTDECGEMPPSPMGNMGKPDAPPPSMSVNLNAQGLDNIEELLSLIKAVNPGMDKPAAPMGGMPHIEIEPMDKPEGGMPKLGGLGDLDKGPLKMLPDMDADNDEKVGGEEGPEEKGEEDKEDEAFGNSVPGSEPEVKDVSAAIPDGNDLNKPKQMVKHSYRQGDNPMAMEGEELRASIRAELLRRLEEAKGAK